MEDTYEVLEDLKRFALGLNGEDHNDEAISRCKCDACQIVNQIIKKQRKLKEVRQDA